MLPMRNSLARKRIFSNSSGNYIAPWMAVNLKKLCEQVILQAVEDLYDDNQREDSVAFFQSKEFMLYAEIAGIDLASRVRLLHFVQQVIAPSARYQARYTEQ
jgi:hypothetical protein